MALSEGQVQIRDLVMGPGTPYEILGDSNPFVRSVRSSQTGARAWAHGSWSGVEWMEEAVVPLNILVVGDSTAEWLPRHHTLQAAFRPVGEIPEDVELRFALGGREYLMFGRPRMIDPQLINVRGNIITKASFVALDPMVYGAEEPVVLTLPTYGGGLTLPTIVPFTIDGVKLSGTAAISNAGTAESTRVHIRIDGPAYWPRIILNRPDGTTGELRLNFEIPEGQWVDIDVYTRTVLMNGTVSRLGATVGDWPVLPPGDSRISFSAVFYNPDAQMTVTARSCWW